VTTIVKVNTSRNHQLHNVLITNNSTLKETVARKCNFFRYFNHFSKKICHLSSSIVFDASLLLVCKLPTFYILMDTLLTQWSLIKPNAKQWIKIIEIVRVTI